KDDGKDLKEFKNAYIRAERSYGLEGISWNDVSSSGFTARLMDVGFIFNDAGPGIFPTFSNFEIAAWLNSKVAGLLFKLLSPTIHYGVGQVSNMPLPDLKSLAETGKLSSSCAQISQTDWDARETSWNFEKSPLLKEVTSLEIAYGTWQEQVTQDFFQLHSNEEELNRIFIDIYGLQEELTPEVPLKDITILQEELNGKDLEALENDFRANGKDAITLPINKAEVMSQFISYAIGLFMGRYRLVKPGLNIAHPNPSAEELASYTYNGGEVIIDEDAIIPLMGKNCNFPDDALQQFQQLLDTIWGHET